MILLLSAQKDDLEMHELLVLLKAHLVVEARSHTIPHDKTEG